MPSKSCVRAFQSLGPAMEKALPPYFLWAMGSFRRHLASEHREHEGLYSPNIDAK